MRIQNYVNVILLGEKLFLSRLLELSNRRISISINGRIENGHTYEAFGSAFKLHTTAFTTLRKIEIDIQMKTMTRKL